jgi:hypothetical protein
VAVPLSNRYVPNLLQLVLMIRVATERARENAIDQLTPYALTAPPMRQHLNGNE